MFLYNKRISVCFTKFNFFFTEDVLELTSQDFESKNTLKGYHFSELQALLQF